MKISIDLTSKEVVELIEVLEGRREMLINFLSITLPESSKKKAKQNLKKATCLLHKINNAVKKQIKN